MATIEAKPSDIEQGGRVRLSATPAPMQDAVPGIAQVVWNLPGRDQDEIEIYDPPTAVARFVWHVPDGLTPGVYDANARLSLTTGAVDVATAEITVTGRPFASGDAVAVTMRRGDTLPTDDQSLWIAIRNSTTNLSFNRYRQFIEPFLCNSLSAAGSAEFDRMQSLRSLPFPDNDRYRVLKVATEVFMMANCGVRVDASRLAAPFAGVDLTQERVRLGLPGIADDPFQAQILAQWENYITESGGNRVPGEEDEGLLPYLAVIRLKLGDIDIVGDRNFGVNCYGILRSKLTNPCLIELLWSYWHRMGHLAHAVNVLLRRFQNVRAGDGNDPLAHVEVDSLRPLAGLLWGISSDRVHQLTDDRVAYELFHQYGITMHDRVSHAMRPADSRVRFLEAFHTLLHELTEFYLRDDDTTVIADPFRVLNAIKEVHLQLTEGQGNQYNDLAWQDRQECLIRQYVLSRPEVREYLPGRTMVAYTEAWMQAAESIKRAYGWSAASVMNFRDLGVFGEQLLLSIRYGNWNGVVLPAQAANWARYWRPEIQGYIHAYHTVTGVDLALDPVDTTMPSVLLRERMRQQLAELGVRPTIGAPSSRTQIRSVAGSLPTVSGRVPAAIPDYFHGR